MSDAIADSARRLAGEVGVETVYTDTRDLIEDPWTVAAALWNRRRGPYVIAV
jgi:hypothetical protein